MISPATVSFDIRLVPHPTYPVFSVGVWPGCFVGFLVGHRSIISKNHFNLYHVSFDFTKSLPSISMQLLRSSQCTCNASQVQSKTSRRTQVGPELEKTGYTPKTVKHTAPLRRGWSNIFIEHKSRKDESRASHRTAFLATISQLPKALYLQNMSSLLSQACCGRPRAGYVGNAIHMQHRIFQSSNLETGKHN